MKKAIALILFALITSVCAQHKRSSNSTLYPTDSVLSAGDSFLFWNEATGLTSNMFWGTVESKIDDMITAGGGGGAGLTSSDLAGATALVVNYAYYDTISATRTFDALPAGSNGDQITITFDVTGATRSVNFHTNSTVYRIGESGALASALSFPVGNHKISLEKRDGKWFLLDSAPDSGPVDKTTGVNYTIGTTNSNELYGGVIYVTASVTITVPAILEKMSFTIIPIGAVTVTVTPQAGETLWLDGVTTAAGDSLESPGTSGALASFTYKSAGAMHASTAAWTAP